MSELQEAFAADLEQLRRYAGLSIAELAKRAGQRSSTVGDLLRGGWVRAPKWELVSALVEVCVAALPAGALDDAAEKRRLGDLTWWHELHADLVRRLTSRPHQPVGSSAQEAVGQTVATYANSVRNLGVHDAIEVGGANNAELPEYVPRGHDHRLRQIVEAARNGTSGAVVLIGDTSTGKTRACWEAIKELPTGWRLWHPLVPQPTSALLGGIDSVQPRTVVWLDELRWYLTAESAAALRQLLADGGRAPVLVLGTMWRTDWSKLRADSPEIDRLLLAARIEVPEAFAGPDLHALTLAARRDPRLRQAERLAPDHRITQYLAGTHELRSAYDTAPAQSKALLHIAMDLRRHGVQQDPPLGFLRDAVTGYLNDVERTGLGDEWLTEALRELAKPRKGVRGPLVLAQPGFPGNGYRLADYLAQQARFARAGEVPPTTFWDAAIRHLGVDSKATLARAAFDFGLIRIGAQLRRHSLPSPSPYYPAELLRLIARVDPAGLPRAAAWVTSIVAGSDLSAVAELSKVLHDNQLDDVLRESHLRTAREMALDEPARIDDALDLFGRYGQHEAVRVLLARDPATHVTWPPAGALDGGLDRTLGAIGAHDQARVLADREAEYRAARRPQLEQLIVAVDPADTRVVVDLLRTVRAADDTVLVQRLLDRDIVGRASLDDLGHVLWLLIDLTPGPDADRLVDRIRAHAASASLEWTVIYDMMLLELGLHLGNLLEILPEARPTFELSADHVKHVRWLAGRGTTPEQYAVVAGLISMGVAELSERDLRELTTTVQQANPELGEGLVRTLARTAPPSTAEFTAWLLAQLRAEARKVVTDLLGRVSWSSVATDHNITDVGQLADELDRIGRVDLIRRIVAARLAAGLDCVPLFPHLDDAVVRGIADSINASNAIVAVLHQLNQRGLKDATVLLAERAAAETDLTVPTAVVALLGTFQELGLAGAIDSLLNRDPVGQLRPSWSRANRRALAELLSLLDSLTTASGPSSVAAEQLDLLIARSTHEPMFVGAYAAAPFTVALREIGRADAVPRLARLVADTGNFTEASRIAPEWARRYRYGREPKGTPSPAWGWDDLG